MSDHSNSPKEQRTDAAKGGERADMLDMAAAAGELLEALFTVKCRNPECGQANRKDSLFCTHCGTRLGGGACQCGSEFPAGATHCPNCGGHIEMSAAPETGRRGSRRRNAGIRWVRHERDVATRMAPSDLKGVLAKGLEVQPGTRALFFVGGRYVATLLPGRHTLESLAQRWKFPTDGEPAAIVVDDGELGIDFDIQGLHSSDHHNVELHAQASLRLAEPESFIANMLRDQSRYSVGELQEFLALEAQRSLRELVAQHPAEALLSGRVSAELEMELLSRWKATLDRTGFTLNRFRVLDFQLPGLEKAEDVRSDVRDALEERRAELEGRQAYFDAELAELDFELGAARRQEDVRIEDDLATLRQKADHLSQRIPLLERVLQEGNLQKMAECGSEEELRKFLNPYLKDQALDEHDLKEFYKVLAAEGAQAEMKRGALHTRIKAMLEHEIAELRANQEIQISLLGLRGDTEVRQEQARALLAELDGQIEARKRKLDQELLESDRKFEQEIGQEKSRADLQHERLQRMVDLDLLRKEKVAALKLQEQVTLAEIDFRRFEKEQESFTMMTADQIMAAAVARSPEKAKEIAESFRAMKSGEATEMQERMYERMIAEAKEGRALDHAKYLASIEADARHRARYEALGEQEKDRAQAIATAGLTADDRKNAQWAFCEIHQMKYLAAAGCPLCKQDKV